VQLLAQFRQDMRRLEDGVLMNNFSDPSLPFRVFATIGLLPGDHMQHVAMCRHLGNAATLADRSSWITKQQRLDCTIDLWDASVMRRRDQTDVVGTQLLREAEVKAHREEKRQAASALRLDVAALVDRDPVREERMKPLRTKYGVKGDQPCPLEGLEVDPPLQAPRDPQHMLYFGLQRLLMTNCYQGMSADQKDNALQRQQDFAWPSGFARITYDFTTKISARYSMEFTAKMFLIVVLTWSDLVPPAKFAVLCQLFAISNKIFAKTRTPDQLETLQDLVTVFIGAAHAEFGELVNRPNMHNLFALVQKDLVLWPNALLFSTNFYECRHQGTLSGCATSCTLSGVLSPMPSSLFVCLCSGEGLRCWLEAALAGGVRSCLRGEAESAAVPAARRHVQRQAWAPPHARLCYSRAGGPPTWSRAPTAPNRSRSHVADACPATLALCGEQGHTCQRQRRQQRQQQRGSCVRQGQQRQRRRRRRFFCCTAADQA
jgi:hypothetical protein